MSVRDTSIGGPGGYFPTTMWSAIEEAQALSESEARERVGRLIGAYWKPIYFCVRAGWSKSAEDAKDLTQSFFAFLLSGDVLQKVQRGRGRFRGFLKSTLRNFLANQHRDEYRIKRGGDETIVALDVSDPEFEALLPAASGRTPEQIFDNEWARTLIKNSIEDFEKREREAGHAVTMDVFRRFQAPGEGGEGPVYERIAAELGITRDSVEHHLQKARAAIRDLILERIKEYALDDVEIQQELELIRNAWT